MTDRAIFNRKYTDYIPDGQRVWLVNGAGVTTTPITTQTFTAGTNLIQGDAVYISGVYVLPASAASGVSPTQYAVIGLTAAAASGSNPVSVVLDDVAVVSSTNLVGDTQLIPGEYYYLSKYAGKLTRYSTSSGVVTASGGYSALVSVGQALSPSELQLEIEPSVILYD